MERMTNGISPTARIGRNLCIGDNCVIEDGAIVGDDVTIGRNVVLKKGVSLGSGCRIEDNVIVGYSNLTRIYERGADKDKTAIGAGTLIRPNSVVYIGCSIGANGRIHHNVVIREATIIGDNTSIGCLVKCEGYASIGSNCSIHSLSSITPFMQIEDFVFIGPGTITLNDVTIDYERQGVSEKKAPKIKFGARIGGNATLCPGVVVGREAFVAAGSLVVRDVPDYCKVAGVPARAIGRVSEAERIRGKKIPCSE